MAWTCSKCETKNPQNARKCGKCGDMTDAPKQFTPALIIGGALVFFIIYMVGSFVGGTLVAGYLEPTDEAVLAVYNKDKPKEDQAKKMENVSSDDRKAAKEVAIAANKENMPVLVRSILFWLIPFLLFPLMGMVVGFVSSGWTVIEAAIGSVIGQVLSFVVMRFMYSMEIGFIELIVGVVIGFVLAGAGAYVGEAVQEKRERTALEYEDMEAGF